MSDLESLIRYGRDVRYLPADYAVNWEDLFEDPIAAVPEIAGKIRAWQQEIILSLQGQTLIDLGSGIPRKAIVDLIRHAGIAKYIPVDLHEGKYINPEEVDLLGVEIIPFQEDMLAVAASMPDDSVNFMINGIDDAVIHSSRYHDALAREIVRATRPGGLIFSCNSSVARNFLWDKDYSSIVKPFDWREREYRDDWSTQIFQKRSE